MMGGPGDAELYDTAFTDFRPPQGITFQAVCLGGNDDATIAAAKAADVIAVNGHVVELRRLAEELSVMPGKRVYALPHRRLSPNTRVLAATELEPYRSNMTPANCRAIALWLMKKEFKADVTVPLPEVLPETGLLHPERQEWFKDMNEFRDWSQKNNRWKQGGLVACTFHSPNFTEHERRLLTEIAQTFESHGLNFVVVFGSEIPILKMLADKKQPPVDAILAFSFKYKAGLGKDLHTAMAKLGVPVFNALSLYRQTTEQWRESSRGMNDFAVAFGFIAPEASGLIEPTLLYGSVESPQATGRVHRLPELMRGNLEQLASRMAKWADLRHKPNADKHIAIFVYNGAGGKQSIAASGLNVFESLHSILTAFQKENYKLDGAIPSTDELTKQLLKGARNAGSWAPGEIQALAESGMAVLLPIKEYSKWFAEIPQPLQDSVIEAWGTPTQSKIMRFQDSFVLPMLRLGNVIILPEPMRGWLDDPHKMLHSRELPPHHQYLAAYIWLKRHFHADAMIHLGRHGSSEWLPGKQLGLDYTDAAAFVRSDIPEIYPYISDGIGEGVVAKRRAAAVIIDHLTPMLRVSAGEIDWPSLQRQVSECESADPAVQPQRREALRSHLRTLALPTEIDLNANDWFEEFSEYTESRTQPAPYGLHTFGQPPTQEEIEATAALLPEDQRTVAKRAMSQSGDDEMTALLDALSGRFIRPGPSGDPLRRPGMPTGRNFYSFDPAKIPTQAAYNQAVELADNLLAKEYARLGHYPRTIAIMLWAGEAIRTDGHSESLALALMGMEPTYDKQGNCTGMKPIPAIRLNRPRVDVLLTTSGAYRDQFGGAIALLENARKQAATLSDTENYINANRPGVFFPKPGTYGIRLNRVTGASWLWDDRNPIVQNYLENMAFTSDENVQARDALEQAAKTVESVVQSRSSNIYGVTDIDESFQYLGGLFAAVESLSGNAPSEYIADLRRLNQAKTVQLQNFLAAELDSRLLNRDWLARMMQENYAGASLLSRMVDNLWGWQATAPHLVTQETWSQVHKVLVEDSHGLGLREFMSQDREWAYQSITARLLEATRKGFWSPGEEIRKELASGYLHSVLKAGMACCDHTCNNPTLNQMVVQLVSVPGGLPSDVVQQFRLAVEQAIGQKLDTAEKSQQELKQQLAQGFSRNGQSRQQSEEPRETRDEQARETSQDAVPVKGFKLKQAIESKDDAQIPASGLEWKVLLAIFAIIGIFAIGAIRNRQK
ncbi:MAG: cobaltochelatase subunit CobN [Victivallales bacterium]|nr:cobaltochelatase subunit CobN [Victivallales bacterium]